MDSRVTLFHLMFGEQALTARDNAAEGLARWAALFEDWLEERRGSQPRERRRSWIVWSEFLPLVRKPPWEASESDVRVYLNWLHSQSKTDKRIRRSLDELSSFYAYAARRGEAAADPTALIPRPKFRHYEGARYLDAAQIEALLAAINPQDSPLGRRDYALILGQIASPLRPDELRLLRWGQLEIDGPAARVRIPAQLRRRRSWIMAAGEGVQGEPAPAPNEEGEAKAEEGGWITAALTAEVVEAILDWLRASGRLASIAPEDYIFTPQAAPFLGEAALLRASAWDGSRAIGATNSFYCLRKYARLAGLDESQINWYVLRNSAVLLRVEAGDSSAEIQEYFGFTIRGKHRLAGTRWLINSLLRNGKKVAWKTLPPNEAGSGNLPTKENTAHAFYAPAIPAADLARLEASKPSGVAGEIDGLRVLLYHGLKHAMENHDPGEILRLIETYSSATQRMANALKAQTQLAGKPAVDELSWTEIAQEILKEEGWE
jgi:integrase